MKSLRQPDYSPSDFPDMPAPFTSFGPSHPHAWCERDLLQNNALEWCLWEMVHSSKNSKDFSPLFLYRRSSPKHVKIWSKWYSKQCSVSLAGANTGGRTGRSEWPNVRRFYNSRTVGGVSWEQAGKTGSDGKPPDKTIKKHCHRAYAPLADSVKTELLLVTDRPSKTLCGTVAHPCVFRASLFFCLPQ